MRGRVPSRQATGLYVHSSPPTGVPVHDSVVRQWLRGGEIARLRDLVLEGDGPSLVGEYSPDVSARTFLRALPRILSRIDEAHKAAAEGDVERTERAVKRERAVRVELSKDHAGLSLLHKAVIHGHHKLQEWLLANFPEIVHLTDRERRTALHYAGSSPDSEEVWKRLTEAGADPSLTDSGGNTAAYYMHHPRRARPPQPRGSQPRQDKGGLIVKPANIRIWIHDRDLGRLQKVVWEGHGQKLLSETSTQSKVRRFLGAVPYILGTIRDVHKAAIENDVETLTKKAEDPVPKDILLSKDINGLNPLHKAAGLGQKEAVNEILSRAPEAANAQDNLGRTPLHYAAGLRDPELYQLLVEAGATDHLQDKKGNTPSYYRSKPVELDGHRLLNQVPEAPRTAHIFPPSWDWRLLQTTATGVRHQDSVEAVTQDSPAEDVTQEEVSKEEAADEMRPEVSEDEGVGSENAQSVDDTASPQNSENIDMVPLDESEDRLGQAVTISRSEIFGEDSGIADAEAESPSKLNEGLQELTTEQPKDGTEGNNNIDPSPQDESNVIQEKEITDDEVRSKGDNAESKDEVPDDNVESTDEKPDDKAESKEEVLDDNVESTDEKPDDNVESKEELPDDNMESKEEASNDNIQSNEEVPDDNMHSRQEEINVDNLESKTEEIEDDNTELKEDKEQDNSKGYEEESPFENTKESEKNENAKSPLEEINENEENKNLEPKPEESEERNDQEATPKNKNEKESDESVENELETANELDNANVEGNNSNSNPEELENIEEEAGKSRIIDSNTENENNTNQTLEEDDKAHSTLKIDNETGEQTNEAEESQYQSTSATSDGFDNVERSEVNPSSEENEIDVETINELDNEIAPEKANNVQSGRQSLKSRLEKVIRLGRGHTEDEESTLNELNSHNSHSVDNDGENMENNDEDKGPESKEETEEAKESNEEYPDSLEGTPQKRPPSNNIKEHDPQETETDEIDEQSSEKSTATMSADRKGDRRTEAERLVASGDMEGMAEMVLSGEGETLLGLRSDNPDVQLFINNVPQYMAKIEKVHKASREGDLRGVQTSLDRRKFAVARDNATSLKPTPLHVAVLFGRTSVLRYLAGRFPETMHAQDSGGRTPLHYASTLPDNGHFYSLLITLGADKAIQDNAGKTAEYYLRNNGDLTREMLLAEYQDRTVPIDTSGLNFNRYSDKGAEILREGYPIFKPEEGQYLASTLGEPLIKGLTEVAHLRPSNPIIHLANFLLAFKKSEEFEEIQKGLRSIENSPVGHDTAEKVDNNEEEGENNNEDGENENIEESQDVESEEPDGEKEIDHEVDDEDEEDIDGIQNDDEDRNSPDKGEGFKNVNRDEHGQSMLHFAAARSHGRNAMYQLLQEMDANPGLRDSLYRTARDIAEQMEITENIKGIDRYIVSLAARGEERRLKELLLEGYDHIIDADDGGKIMDIVEERRQESVLEFLKGITSFEENREKLHRAIRFGSLTQVQEIFNKSGSKHSLAKAKNTQGRSSLHVAVLAQHEVTVEHIATKYPATLHIGDNLMRTPLHYAMALEKVEPLSRILIAAGAQRVLKDLKGRQPSYYFMNKTDIQKLQEEEEALRV